MIQLKIRTEYSFGQTFAPISRVIERGKELGCTAMGIVDNNTWGHVPFYNACHQAGIKPLLGVEACVSDDDFPLYMWFLAKNQAGLSELYRSLSKSYQQTLQTNRGSIPRLYRYDVRAFSSNIIKFAGQITDEDFLKDICAYADLSPESQILNVRKKQLGLPLVSVSDNAFVYADDEQIFELACKGGLKVTPQYILSELDHQDVAFDIARQCQIKLPHAPMLRVEGDLEMLCRQHNRKLEWNDEYEERLKYELGLIISKSFDSYFLIVADMVHFAKQHMLVGPSRGSAAGSLVCYLTNITEIDPIPSKLFFERFIDINRNDPPDIDLDFPDGKRDLVLKYMEQKYGANNVAHIGTISTFRPKSALIQVCKALSIPISETTAVKMVIFERAPSDERANKCLEDTFKETAPGQEFIQQYPQAQAASLLEGHSSHSGVHAAGLLVCHDDITNYCVVDNKGIAHIEKYSIESLGLLKIDILGLRTLSVLEDSGVDIDWYNLKWNDPKTYDLFNSGRLCGIFQFDGNAMRNVSSQITFKTINEIDAVTALARPGPLSSGITAKYIERFNGLAYDDDLSRHHMQDTFGLPLYQEQTMSIVRNIGGFNWEDTILVRKGIGKSQGSEYFKPFEEKFLAGALSKGVPELEALKIWQMIIAMGAYQMNKAHTFSYAVISYWTAYLKANYPLEFLSSTLRNAKDEDHSIMLLREMHNEGFEFVPFDVDKSEVNWCVKDGVLYGGFTSLKGIGAVKAAKLVSDRNAGRLTQKQKDMLADCQNKFANLFPFHVSYSDMYEHPKEYGIVDKVYDISGINKAGDVSHDESVVFMGEVTRKLVRNAQDKSKDKVLTGPLNYLDVYLRDDTGEIGGRVARYDFKRIGQHFPPVGAHILVRATFYNNIPWAFIKKWKVIDEFDCK
jgi:DNA polymerase III alpha subunit